MAELISLDRFDAVKRQYHIYRIRSSTVSHQTHYHDYFQICFVTRGELLHSQGDDAVLLTPGDAFVIPPGCAHSLQFTGKLAEVYSLSFAPGIFDAGLRQTGIWQFLSELQPNPSVPVRLRIVLQQEDCASTLSLMECLLRQQQQERGGPLSAAPGMICAIVCLLAQSYYRQPQNAHRLDQLTDQNQTFLRCTQYIDAHFRETISLAELARQFGFSRANFCAIFPQLTGMTPHSYIAQKRVREAQLLLRSHPDWPLHRVAAEVGFEDPSTFFRNFQKFAGMSPAKYRKIYARSK